MPEEVISKLDTLYKLRDAVEKAIEEHGNMEVIVLACYAACGPIVGAELGVESLDGVFCLITDIMTG